VIDKRATVRESTLVVCGWGEFLAISEKRSAKSYLRSGACY